MTNKEVVAFFTKKNQFMKRLTFTICAAAFLLASCSNDKKTDEPIKGDATVSSADSKPEEKAWIPIDSAMAMNAMMEAGKLGEEHKMLAKSNGTWAAEMTYWEGMDKPAQKMSGTEVTTSILGGHYQQSKFSANWMGMPFEGISTITYDNTTKQYVSTWIENMSTSIMIMRGTWDEASKSLVLTGSQKNPANGLDCKMRQILKMPDDNTQVMEMYGPDGQTGKEYKMMEIKYTRKK